MFKSGLLTRESPCKVNKLTRNGYIPDYALTKLPQTQPTPHANHMHHLIIFSYFLTSRLVTATLLIELLTNDRFLRLYAIKINFSPQINTHLLSLLKNCDVSMVQSTNCIIILVPIPSVPKPPFLTVVISC